MKKFIKLSAVLSLLLTSGVLLTSCEDFLNPEQEIKITEDRLFDDWYEYRSISMGMYSLMQNLSEQIMILGELRGDLLEITPNSDRDLVEIYNFDISSNNKYASPTNFFKLINASNNLIRMLERNQPQVLDPESPITNYDRLYGEALCMRAWAYFSAVQIFGKVPFIPESLVTMEEVKAFANSPVTYVDSIYIEFGLDGYYNDTIYNRPVELERNLYDTEMIIAKFTRQLENNIRAVGVNHYINNNDVSWEITIWNTYAMHALLGQMYITQGDYFKAREHFNQIIYNNAIEPRYQLDFSFAETNWRNIFMGIDNREHILSMPFNKATYQQNNFQSLFTPWGPHSYQLKPTKVAIDHWETTWRHQTISRNNTNPSLTRMSTVGLPGDLHRGFGVSYVYALGDNILPVEQYNQMLDLRARGDDFGSRNILIGYDPVVYKYSIGKNVFDQDADFMVYRAADIHLYMAEILTYLRYQDAGGALRTDYRYAIGFLNDGSIDPQSITLSRSRLGVRGRVSIGLRLNPTSINRVFGDDQITMDDIIYLQDPYTNEVIGFRNFTGNLPAKQRYFVDNILDERARELAFEGKRFYDIMRVARKRNDPDYLARIVSSKFPEGRRDEIRSLLQDENNWYINYFE